MSRSTRGKGPWRLVWESDILTSSGARKLELELKKQKGGNGFYKLTGLQKVLMAALRRGGAAPATKFLPVQAPGFQRQFLCARKELPRKIAQGKIRAR
jgi:hypothetical protein